MERMNVLSNRQDGVQLLLTLSGREEFNEKINEYLHDDKMDVLHFVSGKMLVEAAANPNYAAILSEDCELLPGENSLFSKELLRGIRDSYIIDYRALKSLLIEKRSGIHSVYLVGDNKKKMHSFMECLNFRNPDLSFAGAYFVDPSVSEEMKLSDELIVNEINGADTDIVIVMMEIPRQAVWMKENRTIVHSKMCMGIGAVVDQFVKRYRKAPRFFELFHLEKLYHQIVCHEKITQGFRRRILWKRLGNAKGKENDNKA